MKKIRLFILSLAGIIILSSMAWVKISLLHPALIVLPGHIKNVAIIDRTLQGESAENRIEQVLTGEIFKQDEQAVRQVAEGLIDECSEYNLYNLERTTERFIGGGTKSTFPIPLNWDTVSILCEKYHADAILAIEIFDSDFLITNPGNVARQVLEGRDILLMVLPLLILG